MDRLFRQSSRYRPKWDERHYTDGRTYGEVTISKAIVFWQERSKGWENRNCFSEDGQFLPPALAEAIKAEYRFAREYEQLYVYQDGAYRKTDSQFIKQRCMEALGDNYHDNRGTEVAKYIQTKIRPDAFFTYDLRRINVKNGLLDWETATLLDHSPDSRSNIQIPVAFDPSEACPRIDKFLADVLPSDCIGLVHEFFGYCLLPLTKLQVAFLLKSGGDSGKSVFLFLLQAFLGDENYASETLQALGENRFRAANLAGKLANIFADIPARAIEDSSTFKALVGGDTLTAEKKGRDPFTFKNTARLVFSCNEAPRTTDNTHGFFKRWVVITFLTSFSPVILSGTLSLSRS